MYIAGVKQSADTGNTYFNEISKLSIAGAEIARRSLQRDGIKNTEVAKGKPLQARVEYARWIVDCPNCHSAEFAFEDGLFLCSSCGNSDVNGKVKKVKMPKGRKQIEDILGKRKIINRHWNIGETIEKLQAENDKGVE